MQNESIHALREALHTEARKLKRNKAKSRGQSVIDASHAKIEALTDALASREIYRHARLLHNARNDLDADPAAVAHVADALAARVKEHPGPARKVADELDVSNHYVDAGALRAMLARHAARGLLDEMGG